MDVKKFKKTVDDFFSSQGFVKDGNNYRLHQKEMTIVIGLQKSSYSSDYYINLGFVISQLNPDLIKPRDVNGNIRARFGAP